MGGPDLPSIKIIDEVDVESPITLNRNGNNKIWTGKTPRQPLACALGTQFQIKFSMYADNMLVSVSNSAASCQQYCVQRILLVGYLAITLNKSEGHSSQPLHS